MNIRNLLIYVIAINIMLGVFANLGGFVPVAGDSGSVIPPDPNADFENIETGVSMGNNVEDTTGQEVGYGFSILQSFSLVDRVIILAFGLPYFIGMFGTGAAISQLAWGIGFLLAVMYVWLAMELVRGYRAA